MICKSFIKKQLFNQHTSKALMQVKRIMQTLFLLCSFFSFFCFTLTAYAQDDENSYLEQQKARESDIIAPYQQEIIELAARAEAKSQAPDIQASIQALQSRNILPPSNDETLQSGQSIMQNLTSISAISGKPHVLIFISSSMPEASIVQWMKEARETQGLHAAMVMRGLINNSLKDTKLFISNIVQQTGGTGGVSIDPLAFERYGIQKVPAVVVSNGNPSCRSINDCAMPVFDVVYGNTSLSYALKVIAEKGDLAAGLQNILSQQRKINEISEKKGSNEGDENG